MTKLETYLFFDGDCAEAMKFYEQVLSGKLSVVPVKGSPAEPHVPPGSEDKLLHARLDVDGAVIMASDWLDTTPFPGQSGFSVTLTVADAAAAKALFDKLLEGGKATMPFGKTFWSEGFGQVVDKFGTPWMVMAESNPQS